MFWGRCRLCPVELLSLIRYHRYHAWHAILLTHWGRVTHICVSKSTIIGSDNGLSPDRRQAIIWPNTGILLIRTLGTNFSDFLSEIRAFSFKKMHLKMSSGKWRPSCLGLNVLSLAKHMARGWYTLPCIVQDPINSDFNFKSYCNWKHPTVNSLI